MSALPGGPQGCTVPECWATPHPLRGSPSWPRGGALFGCPLAPPAGSLGSTALFPSSVRLSCHVIVFKNIVAVVSTSTLNVLKSKLNCFGSMEHSGLASVRCFIPPIRIKYKRINDSNLVARSPPAVLWKHYNVYTEVTTVALIWEIRICVLDIQILGSVWEMEGHM